MLLMKLFQRNVLLAEKNRTRLIGIILEEGKKRSENTSIWNKETRNIVRKKKQHGIVNIRKKS